MQIEVTTGVFWDTETAEQSEETLTWLQETVRPNLSVATLDNYRRPFERTWENETVTVVERQIYISDSSSWGRKGVEYIITQKQ